MADDAIDDVLDFWFGRLDEHGCADPEHAARWWKKDPDLDQEIRRRFGELHRAIGRHELDGWLADPRGRLAQIIVLDQFSRNMYRDTPAMFASDPQALELALEGLARGDDRELPHDQRAFMYMPLMHCEELLHQDQVVALFARLRDSAPPSVRERAVAAARYAEMHRDMVKRFGRFPHRNPILGRESSPEEVAFLQQPGSRF